MAAFVVVTPPPTAGLPPAEKRLGIFPGSATPALFPACEPFWVGYGFVPDPDDREHELSGLDSNTRFELEVDGERVCVEEEVVIEEGRAVSKRCIAHFESGLPAGWHRLTGRWYDGGALVLTCDESIEFVER